jgi:hypothetical protein
MPDFILTFTREGESLYTQATGQPRLEISPSSNSTFTITQVNASIEFHRNADDRVDSLTLIRAESSMPLAWTSRHGNQRLRSWPGSQVAIIATR